MIDIRVVGFVCVCVCVFIIDLFFSPDVDSKSGCPVHVGDAGFHILHHKVPPRDFSQLSLHILISFVCVCVSPCVHVCVSSSSASLHQEVPSHLNDQISSS